VFPVRNELGFYIPEDDILHSNRHENLKCYKGRRYMDQDEEVYHWRPTTNITYSKKLRERRAFKVKYNCAWSYSIYLDMKAYGKAEVPFQVSFRCALDGGAYSISGTVALEPMRATSMQVIETG
jgi:hypothetical protein